MMNPVDYLLAYKTPYCHQHPEGMQRIGMKRIQSRATWVNRLRFGRQQRYRQDLYRRHFDALLEDNGSVNRERGRMVEGVLLDRSLDWPHLDRVLEDAERYIGERGAQKQGLEGREFVRNLFDPRDIERFPSFLDFLLSSDVLSVAAEYLGLVPILSTTVPPAIRFMESDLRYETETDPPPRQSQLYHLDPHAPRMVYVVVALRDVELESGPFTYLDAAASRRLAEAVSYGEPGVPFRLPDERVAPHLDPADETVLTCPRGTVLFFDSTRCFHYGSRNPVVPRYLMMYALAPPIRADFSEWYATPQTYRPGPGDSELRKLVLDRSYRSPRFPVDR